MSAEAEIAAALRVLEEAEERYLQLCKRWEQPRNPILLDPEDVKCDQGNAWAKGHLAGYAAEMVDAMSCFDGFDHYPCWSDLSARARLDTKMVHDLPELPMGYRS